MNSTVLASMCVAWAVLLLEGRSRGRLRVLDGGPPATDYSSAASWLPRRWPWARIDYRLDVVRVADAWAGELGAGRPAVAALERALLLGPEPMLAAARRIATGADPGPVLTGLAALRGGDGARALAGCWVIAATGGALGATVERTADALRDELALRAEVRSQVAAPRATARLLAVMPLVGPVLGALVGADTVGVLVGTGTGRALLIGGLGLNAIGWWWVQRLVRSAERAA